MFSNEAPQRRHRGRLVVTPVVFEPAVVPTPLLAARIPPEMTNIETTTATTIDHAPEIDTLIFPFLGNELRIGEVEVE